MMLARAVGEHVEHERPPFGVVAVVRRDFAR